MIAATYIEPGSSLFESDLPLKVTIITIITLIEVAIACGILYGIYVLLTLPMRRNERARIFLDLLELGLNDGRTPEQAITDAASSRDRSPGARFYMVAAHLHGGARLSDALQRVPRLLPPQMRAMLKAGERIGDARKVLPACRKLLGDGVSQVRGALNYLLVLMFVITPGMITVPIMLMVLVIPKFKEVFAGLAMGAPFPPVTTFVLDHSRQIVWAQLAVIVFIWLLMVAYVGGPRIQGWIRRVLPGVPDWVLFRLAWRRRRMQRDFSAMLAVLLDAGVPEPEAVALAADSTANALVRHRAAKVISRLNSGVPLPDALQVMDDSGELHWRLSNALHRGAGFLRALAGWHDALDAKAFQSEQAAAQITTSLLVLFNGLVVAAFVIGLFAALVDLIMQVTLW